MILDVSKFISSTHVVRVFTMIYSLNNCFNTLHICLNIEKKTENCISNYNCLTKIEIKVIAILNTIFLVYCNILFYFDLQL